MEDKDRFIDELLDAALAQQRGAESGPGLEGRILERVRTSAAEQSSSKRAWVAVTAMVAAVVLVIAIHMANRSHSPALQTPQVSKAAPVPAPNEKLAASSETARQPLSPAAATPRERAEGHKKKTPGRTVVHHWPSQFPTPAPLSPEEKALVQYVRDTPPQVLAASLFKKRFLDRGVEIEPLKIAPLEIKPLSVGPTGEEIQ